MTFRILEKVMAVLNTVEMPELHWKMVEGGIKETKGSGHAKNGYISKARKLTRGL